MKFGDKFWGEVKIDALKMGGVYKQKGNDNSISRLTKQLNQQQVITSAK